MTFPADRIPLFLDRLRELTAEAALPCFDSYDYAAREETLIVLWEDPSFCLAIPLRSASLYSQTADELRAAWIRKFGGDWEARLARRRAAGRTL